MEIIDAQFHLNRFGTVALALAAMDAAGISAVLIDEEAPELSAGWRYLPGIELVGGAIRSVYPMSEQAVAVHPHRFAYLGCVDRLDPEWERIMGEMRRVPNRLCIRVQPRADNGEADAFESGAYEPFFAAAQRHGVPAFVLLQGRTHQLARYAEKFPDQTFIIDHCGVAAPGPEVSGEARFGGLYQATKLAKYPNVALKWCHGPRFSEQRYPWHDLMAHFVRVVEAFGPERVVWAADHSQSRGQYSWAEAAFFIRDAIELSASDKQWILSGALRKLLRWPKTDASS